MSKTPTRPLDVTELLVHREWLQRLARSLVQDDTAAEDAVQQTYVAALERPPRHRGNLRAWLATTVRNFALRERRGQSRRSRREAKAAVTDIAPAARSSAESAELQRRAICLVLDLAEPYRSVVLLRFFEDLKAREIGQRLGVPTGTVESRLHRAMTRIRAQLDLEYGNRHCWVLAFASAKLLPKATPIALTTKLVAGGAILAAASAVVLIQSPEDEPTAPPPSLVASAGSPADPPVDERDRSGAVDETALEEFSASMAADGNLRRPSATPPKVTDPPATELRKKPHPRLGLVIDAFEAKLIDEVSEYWGELDVDRPKRALKLFDRIVSVVEREQERRDSPVLSDVESLEQVFMAASSRTSRKAIRRTARPRFQRVTLQERELGWCLLSRPWAAATPVLLVLGPPESQLHRRWGPIEALRIWAEERYAALLPSAILLVVPLSLDDENAQLESMGYQVDGDVSLRWTQEQPLARALAALGELVLRGPIHDRHRIYLDAAPEHTASLVELGARFPSLFAGLILRGDQSGATPVNGALRPGSPRRHNLRHLHALIRSAIPSVLYPEHERTDTALEFTGEAVLEFANSNEKAALPSPIHHHFQKLAHGTAYWFRVTGLDSLRLHDQDHAFVSAAYDHEQGRVALITHPAVTQLTLYFNDRMLDLDQPFTIEHRRQGTAPAHQEPLDSASPVVWSGTATRNLQLTVDLPYHQTVGNPGEVFTASVTLELE